MIIGNDYYRLYFINCYLNKLHSSNSFTVTPSVDLYWNKLFISQIEDSLKKSQTRQFLFLTKQKRNKN